MVGRGALPTNSLQLSVHRCRHAGQLLAPLVLHINDHNPQILQENCTVVAKPMMVFRIELSEFVDS